MKRISLSLLLLFVLVLSAMAGDSVKNSVVKIFTVSNSPSYYQPWQMRGQSASSGSGCIISGKRILTNAHVVSDVTFIQVRKFGRTE
ncbi:MAG TPA: trypsin-like serine protease, partial [Candidatus Goldiibacteriota bacterium]|nr:trypsin-like serine protease [Candidatus Goldiibacteriota bacterium]